VGTPPPNEQSEVEDNIAYMQSMKAKMEAQAARGELPQYMNDPSLASATFNIEHAYGTVDDAISYVEELEDAGVDEVMCMIQMGTVPQAVCMETMRAWGRHVIPHFRKS
jgi:hypothetical protein